MLTPGTRTFSALEQEYVNDRREHPPPITNTLPVVLALWRDTDKEGGVEKGEPTTDQKGKSGGSTQEYLFGFCSVDASTGAFKVRACAKLICWNAPLRSANGYKALS